MMVGTLAESNADVSLGTLHGGYICCRGCADGGLDGRWGRWRGGRRAPGEMWGVVGAGEVAGG